MASITKAQRLILAGVLAGTGYGLDHLLEMHLAADIVLVAATVVAGTPILLKALRALRYKVVGIDALVTIAVLGARAIGEYWEGAAVTFLFMLGDYLEARTIEKTRSSIKALLDMAPSTARVRRDGEECTVGASDVVLGDIVVVRPGERIAVDGTVLEGSAYVDQSAITGESIPVTKVIFPARKNPQQRRHF